jgi:hypothetical protein
MYIRKQLECLRRMDMQEQANAVARARDSENLLLDLQESNKRLEHQVVILRSEILQYEVKCQRHERARETLEQKVLENEHSFNKVYWITWKYELNIHHHQ